MLQIWVIFDLIDDGWDRCGFQDRFDMFPSTIRDTDGFGFAGMLQGLKVGPGLLKNCLVAVGVKRFMKQIQVHVIKTQIIEPLV